MWNNDYTTLSLTRLRYDLDVSNVSRETGISFDHVDTYDVLFLLQFEADSGTIIYTNETPVTSASTSLSLTWITLPLTLIAIHVSRHCTIAVT